MGLTIKTSVLSPAFPGRTGLHSLAAEHNATYINSAFAELFYLSTAFTPSLAQLESLSLPHDWTKNGWNAHGRMFSSLIPARTPQAHLDCFQPPPEEFPTNQCKIQRSESERLLTMFGRPSIFLQVSILFLARSVLTADATPLASPLVPELFGVMRQS